MSDKATFGMGCFWGPDDMFSKMPGVLSVVVGYAGGSTVDPDYEHIGDHTETVDIQFDPNIISYDQLLNVFWREHDPTYKAKTQYKSIIFTHGPKQFEAATKSKEEQQAHLSQPIVTEIRPVGTFYKAEEYHQKYLQKNRGAAC